MVTTLYLIRHGETEGSEVRRYKGSIDVPMSAKGVEQIKKAADFIGSKVKGQGESDNAPKLTAVYCSPLNRALKSAEIIAEPYGLKPVVIRDLRERHFGIWEGLSFDEIREKYPVEFNAWSDNPLKFSPMDGESTLEVRDRVISALSMVLEKHKNENNPPTPPLAKEGRAGFSGEDIAIVAHGGVNRIILCHAMGILLENIFRIEQDFGAVNIVEFRDEYPIVKLLNGVNRIG